MIADYLKRIGWDGPPPAADRASLARIVALHAAAIPFENLDPLLGRVPDLALDALVAKLVHGGRGGYCFEQNGLLEAVLEALGFTVAGLSARVLWGQAEQAITLRSHKLLLVELPEGPVLADVGFGGAVLTGLLALTPGIEQATPHELFRLVEVEGEWCQQIRIGAEWRTTYRFTLEPQLALDYEPANWWCATHPSSHFTHSLTIARALPGRRIGLRGREFSTHVLGGETERRIIAGARDVCDLLEGPFGIRLPDRAALVAKLEAIG